MMQEDDAVPECAPALVSHAPAVVVAYDVSTETRNHSLYKTST